MRILKRSERCGHWVRVYRKSIASFYFFPPSVRFNSIVISMKPNRKEASHLYTSKLFSFVPKWKRGPEIKKKGLLAGWEPTASSTVVDSVQKRKSRTLYINWRKPKSQRKRKFPVTRRTLPAPSSSIRKPAEQSLRKKWKWQKKKRKSETFWSSPFSSSETVSCWHTLGRV